MVLLCELVNEASEVRHGAIANFYIVLKILYSLCDFEECLSRIVKNFLPMLVQTLLLYGRLNHMIFLFLFLFLLIFLLKSGLNLILSLKPLLENALL